MWIKMFHFVVFATLCLSINGLSNNKDNSGVLISKYSKVARWGNNNSSQETGRNFKAQSIWTPRSSASNSGKNQVAYQYPTYHKMDNQESDKVPGIGEVIQDRFQVRPYFGFGKTSPAPVYTAPTPAAQRPVIVPSIPAAPVINVPPPIASPQSLPAPVRSVTFSLPVVSSTPQVPSNLYNSPFTSYNPPPSNQNAGNGDSFPPNAPTSSDSSADSPPSNGDSYADIPLSDSGPYNYQPATSSQPKPPSKPHFNAPYPDLNQDSGKNSDSGHSYGNNGPPHPPKSINDVYYPPDFPKDQIPHDHDSPEMPMNIPPPPDTNTKDDMTADLVPPTHGHDFPKYLYDSPHYDHHVYEEVPHPTTPAPEKKRVSTTNYSYYYLGRKLWYIPLYFSIYFMIYVTALIIKSIARHKVTLRNEWITSHSRSARDTLGTLDHLETVDNIHRNIASALDKAGKLYSNLSM
ncbi:unnamed protein product [Phyllotreta striolata]|uniref:Uncharacterized protein n=1 Tax=Phyllotreta striolata TaxID=444603 RepID=A0A9P0DMW4_PHYSR|nr:unnamed protein product [Phyllotreta striolata]